MLARFLRLVGVPARIALVAMSMPSSWMAATHRWLGEMPSVEHRPVAEEEAHVLLFEPASTLNTGNVRDERTLERLEMI